MLTHEATVECIDQGLDGIVEEDWCHGAPQRVPVEEGA